MSEKSSKKDKDLRDLYIYRSGNYRTVIIVGKYAIKIPAFKTFRGFLQGLVLNINERKFYKKYKHCGKLNRTILGCPFGCFNVQDRVEPLTKQEFRNLGFREWRKIFSGTVEIPARNKIHSFGKNIKGDIVTTDYGTFGK